MFSKFIDIERLIQVVEKFETIKEMKVIGDSGLDCYTFGNVERISPEAPVPVLRMTREKIDRGWQQMCHLISLS